MDYFIYMLGAYPQMLYSEQIGHAFFSTDGKGVYSVHIIRTNRYKSYNEKQLKDFMSANGFNI